MFEGKEIDFIYRNGDKTKGIVVSCIKDVGITIIQKDEPSKILYCLIMKNAPNFPVKEKGLITVTRKLFTTMRKNIIEGIIDYRVSITYTFIATNQDTMHKMCAFQ